MIDRTEQEVLSVYQKVNPSTYLIEKDEDEYNLRKNFIENLFLYRLNFPPKMFENATLLEFGTGTGEHSLFYLKWGASCTFVEMNKLACQRADKLFQFFDIESTKYQIQNKSLFDFRSTKKFDIVISLGVIHHTENKERAFDIKAQYLKSGGFLVLGIGNSAGIFQRNLQRAILYHLANSEEQIVSFADELFSEHLDRAEKFGRRSRKSIIYDSYVNPKIDTLSISEVLSWFSKNNLKLYSSWPPIIPAILGDPADRKPLLYEKLHNTLSIPEIVYLTHTTEDVNQLRKFEKEAVAVMTPFKELVNLLNDVKPDTPLDLVKRKIDTLEAAELKLNPYISYISMLETLLKETRCIIESLQKNCIDDLKKNIENTQVLFRGTCGLGMSWYIGFKT
tara:strand:- start:40 stop:1218 length:1179 start_codon:yes stop_codon:yes gene_type:complete